jgi:NAD(P)-dependent dehydrogenase (short-subunit alcohol dehydrogenase family)
MLLFDSKVVSVTGSGSGIGQAACYLYTRERAQVLVSDIDEKGRPGNRAPYWTGC